MDNKLKMRRACVLFDNFKEAASYRDPYPTNESMFVVKMVMSDTDDRIIGWYAVPVSLIDIVGAN